MTTALLTLRALGDELRAAFAQAEAEQDWSSVAELDASMRERVGLAMQQADQLGDDEVLALQTEMSELLDLYQRMQSVCSSQRDAVAQALGSVSRGRQGAQQYSNNAAL